VAETDVLRGNYRGAQAILEFFGQLAHETQGSLRVEPLTMAASGDHVLVLERITGKRKGRRWTPRMCWFSNWTRAL
jgi:hypothetical protein